jgi:hypothetical protein
MRALGIGNITGASSLRYQYSYYTSPDGINWTNIYDSGAQTITSGIYTCAYSTNYTATKTNLYARFAIMIFPYGNNPNQKTGISKLIFEGFSSDGLTELRIVYGNDSYILAIADDELNLYDSSLNLIAKIGDCTDAEYDAGTYSAACFTPLDDPASVFVFGRFDATNGDTGLTGVHHVISYISATWASVESGWSTEHCASFYAGYDSGSGARYWAIRNGATAAQLYSDVASLTYISDIAAFAVAPDGFHLLDGQTMAVGGKTAAGGAIIYETYNGGTSWTDVTNALPVTGINKVSYA